MKTGWKSWLDYLNDEGDYNQSLRTLQKSSLSIQDPKALRERYLLTRLWRSLVPPNFSKQAEFFFENIRSKQKVQIEKNLGVKLKDEAGQVFIEGLSRFESQEKIVQILGVFITKRPDIGYWTGMNYIVGVLLTVFQRYQDVFVLFSHIVENLYPLDFFTTKNRQLVQFAEFFIFVKLSEKLRPGLFKSLKAIFRNRSNWARQVDLSPFETSLQKLAKEWFSSLFATSLQFQDLLRVLDCFLIQGIDFLHKFGIAFLQKHQRFLKKSIKQEVNIFKLGASVDALIAAGNSSMMKILRKTEKIPIEKLIKKAVFKSNYKSLNREMYLEQAFREEESNLKRVVRLNKTKTILKKLLVPLDRQRSIQISQRLSSVQNQGLLKRATFINFMKNNFQWEYSISLNFFISLEQKGNQEIEVQRLKIGLFILSQSTLEEKLQLVFGLFQGKVDRIQVLELMSKIENCLDYRSNFLQEYLESLQEEINSEDKFNKEDFVRFILSEQIFLYLIQFINTINSEQAIDIKELKIANFDQSGDFSSVNSPFQTSRSISSFSRESQQKSENQELEQKLSLLSFQRTKIQFSIEELIKQTDIVIQTQDDDIEGLFIENNFQNDKLYFIFHIGNINQKNLQILTESKKDSIQLSQLPYVISSDLQKRNSFINQLSQPLFQQNTQIEEGIAMNSQNKALSNFQNPFLQQQKSPQFHQDVFSTSAKTPLQKLDLDSNASQPIETSFQPSKNIRTSCSRLCSRNNCQIF